jgi:hypothetical protein
MIKDNSIDTTNIRLGKNLLNYLRIYNGSNLMLLITQGQHMLAIMSTCKNGLASNNRINGSLVNPSLLASFK